MRTRCGQQTEAADVVRTAGTNSAVRASLIQKYPKTQILACSSFYKNFSKILYYHLPCPDEIWAKVA